MLHPFAFKYKLVLVEQDPLPPQTHLSYFLVLPSPCSPPLPPCAAARAKAGGKQSTKDGTGKYARSAGSRLRRYNELALVSHCYSREPDKQLLSEQVIDFLLLSA